MQPRNTWADTIPPEEIAALRHPLPHPTGQMSSDLVVLREDEFSIEVGTRGLKERRRIEAESGDYILHSTFAQPSRTRRVHIPRKKTDRFGAALLLIGSGLAGYAFGLALVALSNVAGVAA